MDTTLTTAVPGQPSPEPTTGVPVGDQADRATTGRTTSIGKITVAFGPDSESTLRWAADLARLTDAPLEVFHVLQPTSAEVSTRWFDELVTEREDELARLTAELGDLDVTVIVRDGVDPLREFAERLHESPGGLGVVGAHLTGRLARLWFGWPGHWLLHHSDEPVAIVHPDHGPLAGGVVVAAVDGSEGSAAALDCAERFARGIGGSLHAVFVDDGSIAASDADEARSVADRVSTVPVEFHQISGHPAGVLIEHADREAAAAIVVGTRGGGGFEGLTIGRVPSQLIAHATTPLIVVPH